jgi:cytochrome c oxidase subunit 2
LVGNSFKGIWAERRNVVVDGETKEAIVGADYIRKSIYEPNAEVVEGFPQGLMPSYEGMISDEELTQIIEYIKSLGDDAQ